MLSGGGSVGMFHLGILSTLLEHNLLPKVIAGASSGSLASSLIGSNTITELKTLSYSNFQGMDFSDFAKINKKGSFFRKIKRLLKHGYLIDNKPLMKFVKINTHNLTFREAYEKTKIILNISDVFPSKQDIKCPSSIFSCGAAGLSISLI